jgi:hypothetical protein
VCTLYERERERTREGKKEKTASRSVQPSERERERESARASEMVGWKTMAQGGSINATERRKMCEGERGRDRKINKWGGG